MTVKPHNAMRPLLVVAMLGVVVWATLAGVVAWQRKVVVNELAQRVAAGTDAEALAALGQLARMDVAALDTLVEAAGGARPRVAPAARWHLEDLLTRWRRQNPSPTSKSLRKRLTRAAGSLEQHYSKFSPEGKLWARKLAMRLLLTANRLPAGERLDIVSSCELVLSAPAPVPLARSTSATAASATNSSPPPPADEPATRDRQPPQPAAESLASPPRRPLSDDDLINAIGQPLDGQDATTAIQPDAATATPANSIAFAEAGPAATSPVPQSSTSKPRNWRPQWARGGDASAADSAQASPQAQSPDAETTAALVARFADLEPLELLARTVDQDSTEAEVAWQELQRRGFGRLPSELASAFVSGTTDERVRLVDRLADVPGIAAGPWLTVLAEDPQPAVRYAAISTMTTSNNPQLIEQAWQAVLTDRDPRVAELAPRVRNRRDALRPR